MLSQNDTMLLTPEVLSSPLCYTIVSAQKSGTEATVDHTTFQLHINLVGHQFRDALHEGYMKDCFGFSDVTISGHDVMMRGYI